MTEYDAYSWIEKNTLSSGFVTPYLLTDTSYVIDQCKLFRELLPDVGLYYAVKAFPDKKVLQTLKSYIDGYDAASITEIEALLDLGIDASCISYSNPVKSGDSIRSAYERGVSRFAFQSLGELKKIALWAPGSTVYARVHVGDSRGAQSLSAKFGCAPEDVVDLSMQAASFGLQPIGVTFHVGSQAGEADAWTRAIKQAQKIILDLRNAGIQAGHINIGGGLPAHYGPNDPDVADTAQAINQAIASGPSDIDYLAEPGRFLVASSSIIVTEVIGREDRSDKPWLFLDVGAFQAFFEIFEFNRFMYPVYSLRHLQSKAPSASKSFVLTGPTCDAYDTLAYDVSLPADIKEGDRLMIGMTGAYTVAYGSNFNGLTIPIQQYSELQEGVRI